MNTPKRLLKSQKCSVKECDRAAEVLNKSYCRGHYARLRKGGSLNSPLREVRKSRSECQADGCERLDIGPHGYCKMHIQRIRHNGSPYIVKHQRDRDNKLEKHSRWSGESATYDASHQRVRAARGSASSQKCVDCRRQASHWSYTHSDPNEKSSSSGPYSTDPRYYVPRCVSCHKKFDLAHLRVA